MKPSKSYRAPIGERLSKELLNIAPRYLPSETEAKFVDEGGEPLPLGERLEWAVEHLAGVIREANDFLTDSEVARRLAEALAIEQAKRGYPYLFVDAKGTVCLEVSYDNRVKSGRRKRVYSRKLPSMKELRKEAKQLGVNIASFGIKRRAIKNYLDEVKEGKVSSESAEETPEADEIKLSPVQDGPKPPKKPKGFTKTGDPVPSQFAENKNDSIDIEELLGED